MLATAWLMTSSFPAPRRRVELAEAPVDQDQVGEGFLFFLEAAITALNDFLHAREIVISPFATNDELAIAGFFHPPVFPHNHRSHRVGALQMGDIEALDSARRLRQPEGLLERVDNRLRAGLQRPEALLEGVARILFNQLQEGVLRAPLRHQNFDAAARPARDSPPARSECPRGSRGLRNPSAREWRAADTPRPK